MGLLTTTEPPCPHQKQNSSSTRPCNIVAHGSSMTRKFGASAHPHSTTHANTFTYRRRGDNAPPKQYSFPPQRCPFWRLDHGCHPKTSRHFSATGIPAPTPIPTPRRTRTTIQQPLLQRDNDPRSPPRVPPTVPPCCPPRPPPVPQPRVELPERNSPHR